MAGHATDKGKEVEEREDGEKKKKKKRGSCSEMSRTGMMQHII